jgi:hypothetical protein
MKEFIAGITPMPTPLYEGDFVDRILTAALSAVLTLKQY